MTNQLGHRPGLDALRGIACLMVVGYHTNALLPSGYFGVDLFFVLSGFLITTLLLEEWTETGDIRLRQFYARRALRLLPALAVLLALTFFVFQFLEPNEVKPAYALSVAFYYSNWIKALKGLELGQFSHCWSIAIEEQFYLVWPLLLVSMLRLKCKSLFIACILSLGIVTSFFLRNALFHNTPSSFMRVYYGSDTHGEGLLIGSLAAVLWKDGRFKRFRSANRVFGISAFLITVVSVLPEWQPFEVRAGYSIISMSTAALLLAVLHSENKLERMVQNRPLVWVGRRSYSIYLWHPVVFELNQFVFEQVLGEQVAQSTIARATGLVLAFGVASASYTLVEKTFLKLRTHFHFATSAVPQRCPAPVHE